jgi:glycosyltransferase involved in cell wall biosynthesis
MRRRCSLNRKPILQSSKVYIGRGLIDRVFIFPPWQLLLELLNVWEPLKYDICHLVAPLCLAFLPLIPLMWLRGLKVYISYHVYLEYYRNFYLGSGGYITKYSLWLIFRFLHIFSDFIFPLIYYLPLAFFADVVGIPSKTADFYVFQYSARVHLLRSGMDTEIFHPKAATLRMNSQSSEEALVIQDEGIIEDKHIKSMVGESDHVIDDIRDLAGTLKGPVLIYAGRLAMEKEIEFLVQAMARPEMEDATLVIVGDGPERGRLEQQASDIVGKDMVYSTNMMVLIF